LWSTDASASESFIVSNICLRQNQFARSEKQRYTRSKSCFVMAFGSLIKSSKFHPIGAKTTVIFDALGGNFQPGSSTISLRNLLHPPSNVSKFSSTSVSLIYSHSRLLKEANKVLQSSRSPSFTSRTRCVKFLHLEISTSICGSYGTAFNMSLRNVDAFASIK
jgi:hypothetical protein